MRKEKSTDSDAGIKNWQSYCQEVATAAEALREIARNAESAARVASSLNDGVFSLGRNLGLSTVSGNAKTRTYATMMLGAFAALEGLRQQISLR